MAHHRRSLAIPSARSHMQPAQTNTNLQVPAASALSTSSTSEKDVADTVTVHPVNMQSTRLSNSTHNVFPPTINPPINPPTINPPSSHNPPTINPHRKKNENLQDVVLDATSPKVDVYSKIRMFPHQQALTAKMIEMETNPRKGPLVGVLKDPPGSGKSFPLLALMLYEKRQLGRTQNLLVIPHNIHQQWLKYIADFSDELQAMSLMYYGDITAMFYDARALFEYDILITTSSFYDMVTSTVRDIGAWFNRVILDEIDSISFFTMSAIPSQVVWLVSASAELTKSGVYMEYAKKNGVVCDPLFIKRSINLPPPLTEHHSCYNEYVRIMQQGVLNETQLKAVYAVDFTTFKFHYLRHEDAINDAKHLLSAKFRDDSLALHSTIDSIKTLEKGAKYQSYLPQFLAQKVEKKDELEASVKRILALTARKKCALCCEDFSSKILQQKQMDNGENASILTDRKRAKCKHCKVLFCMSCWKSWLQKTPRCPKCCDANMKEDDLEEDNSPVEAVSEPNGLKDKMETFHDILKKEIARKDFRILIFSDMTGTFLKVQEVLKQEKLAFAEIEGNQYTMDRAMADYKSGKRPILLVDSQSYGAGMNMEMTTGVIIMHKTERENQIIGRAQRLGRTERLHVHHLIYPNE